ncbi:haloacid dehalogenase [Methanothermococcus okinawensis]|uniref:haloacid dehalogenase n=1 Tax=Methanothermococcus okinawensis TaxID=155863 RepID=UPI0001E30469
MNIRHIQKKNKNIPLNELTNELTDKIIKLNTMVENYDDFKKYLKTPQQEYVETTVFYNIVFNNRFLGYSEFKEHIKPENYILGLCDVIGELRRIILESIKNDCVEDAKKYYEFMENIYGFIMQFDYYHVIDDLRRKQDVSRNLLEKTNSDLVNFIENLKLRNEIKRLKMK